MKARIGKSKMDGSVAAPPSKSYTIRGLMCAALARGESQIVHPLTSDDTGAAASVLGQVGVDIARGEGSWRVHGGYFHEAAEDLFCRDSAATFRFMIAISSLVPGRCRLVPGASLARRPVQPLLEALAQLGVKCRADGASVIVDGGNLKGGTVRLPADVSSQFISALLLIAPLAEHGVDLRMTTPVQSKPYLKMTMACMEKFGVSVAASEDLSQFEVRRQEYRPVGYQVEGDWSSASYLLALGAALGQVEITNLSAESLQGDRIMLNLLTEMGARVLIGDKSLRVQRSQLKAITADLSDCIDLLPTMAVLAAVADGESRFTGVGRARYKESNRIQALKQGLERMGIDVVEGSDSLNIIGSVPKAATIDSFNDHRIAMAFSILGAVSGGTTITGAECVSKTYPGFWDEVKKLGGKVELNVK
ncbi:MAG: 3-phosphoshikimate 1-carboxyvinyltransferase [Dehalococcoidales bacterium]|nr:3-phosphoshikimate 1-carboxyvinyltransferase [Dehalococcoidales bacterium]